MLRVSRVMQVIRRALRLKCWQYQVLMSPPRERKTVKPLWKSLGFFMKLSVCLPDDPAITFLGSSPKELKTKATFTAASLTIAPNWKQLKVLQQRKAGLSTQWMTTTQKEWTSESHSNRDEPPVHFSMCKKPDPKGYVLYASICRILEKANLA